MNRVQCCCPGAWFPVSTPPTPLPARLDDRLDHFAPLEVRSGCWAGCLGCPWVLRFRPVFFFLSLRCFKVWAEVGGKNLLRAADEGTVHLPRRLKRHSPSVRHLYSQTGKAFTGQHLASCCWAGSGKRSSKVPPTDYKRARHRPEPLTRGQLFFSTPLLNTAEVTA